MLYWNHVKKVSKSYPTPPTSSTSKHRLFQRSEVKTNGKLKLKDFVRFSGLRLDSPDRHYLIKDGEQD